MGGIHGNPSQDSLGHPDRDRCSPALGLAGVNLHTWTGWGSVTHWNAFVAVLETQGKGTFIDSRLTTHSASPWRRKQGLETLETIRIS